MSRRSKTVATVRGVKEDLPLWLGLDQADLRRRYGLERGRWDNSGRSWRKSQQTVAGMIEISPSVGRYGRSTSDRLLGTWALNYSHGLDSCRRHVRRFAGKYSSRELSRLLGRYLNLQGFGEYCWGG